MDTAQPRREEVDRLPGITLLEFGSSWCGYCRRAQPLVAEVLAGREGLRHLRIEDGSGRPLGRSFGVKLWPTFVVVKDGVEVARVVRPAGAEELRGALAKAGA